MVERDVKMRHLEYNAIRTKSDETGSAVTNTNIDIYIWT